MVLEILILLIHIIVCAVVYLKMKQGILDYHWMLWLLACLIPLWGPVCMVILNRSLRDETNVEVALEKDEMKIEDEVFQTILVDEDVVHKDVVPIQEALIMNNPKLRRELLMDLLYSDPSEFVNQLKEASMNDDTEVVHYAVTALVELQKEFDLKFQDLEQRELRKPDDKELLREREYLMEQYIESGLMEGSNLKVQLYNYLELLEKEIEKGFGNYTVQCKRIETKLRLNELEGLSQSIEDVIAWRPMSEKGYLYRIQYYAMKKDREKILETIRWIHDKQVYVSKEGKIILDFWQE